MASGVYQEFKKQCLEKKIDILNDTIKVSLMSNSHAFDADDAEWADVSANEVAWGGYAALTLTGAAIIVDSGADTIAINFDNATWTNMTGSAYHAVIWDDTAAGDPLIASIDFGGEQAVSAADFNIVWAAAGAILLD